MPAIDDDHYQRGHLAFANGVALRALIEPLLIVDRTDDPDRDGKEISFVLGFVDAAFDKLRGIER